MMHVLICSYMVWSVMYASMSEGGEVSRWVWGVVVPVPPLLISCLLFLLGFLVLFPIYCVMVIYVCILYNTQSFYLGKIKFISWLSDWKSMTVKWKPESQEDSGPSILKEGAGGVTCPPQEMEGSLHAAALNAKTRKQTRHCNKLRG